MGDRITTTAKEEISLRELLLTLWQSKVLIAIVTIIAIVLSLLFSFVTDKELYQAEVSYTIKNGKLTDLATKDDTAVLEEMEDKFALSTTESSEQIRSNAYLEVLLATIRSQDETFAIEDAKAFKDMLEVETTDKSEILVTITNSSNNIVTAILDNLLPAYSLYLEDVTQKSHEKYLVSVESSVTSSKEDLDEITTELTSFRVEHGSVELLEDKLENAKEQIAALHKTNINLETNIAIDLATIEVVRNQLLKGGYTDISEASILSEIRQTVGSNSTITLDAEVYLQNALPMDGDQITQSIFLIEHNRLQLKLINSYNQLQANTDKLGLYSEDYRVLYEENLKLNNDYLNIKNEYDVAKLTYGSQNRKYNLATSVRLQERIVPSVTAGVSSDAPENIAGSDFVQNAIYGLGIGFVLSAAYVVLRRQRQTSPSSPKESN